ncbi:MAG: MBOAT family protein [Chloroflexi bacterium]|nr:MBOAT family protein [Chloroflexota bacterium]
MSFVSIEFLIFFIVVLGVYFSLKGTARLAFLMAASYFFYIYWNVSYIFLILFTAGIDYFTALKIDALPLEDRRRRQRWLLLSIVSNMGVLFTFKYFNFFADSIYDLLTSLGVDVSPVTLNVLLPVGISFYTFQSLAYTIDVYRGNLKAERSVVRFLTFVAFFPQLVAGPIERATHLLPQFYVDHRFDYARTVEGFRYILWGAFKKLVIADRLAIYVNAVYNSADDYSGLTLINATVFFAFQIYCDFSGYSDIAVGAAKIMGFDLMVNFRQPYLSQSIREFWRRWHISLSTWFRDYLYIPLGGNRKGFGRMLGNLFVVFVISGLWHGANWTFLIWGALHGGMIVVESIGARRSWGKRVPHLARWAATFVLVCIAWVFFRANTVEDAFHVLGNILDFSGGASGVELPFAGGLLGPSAEFALSWALIAGLMVYDALDSRVGRFNVALHTRLRWAAYYGLGLGIVFSFIYGLTTQTFIYFQF